MSETADNPIMEIVDSFDLLPVEQCRAKFNELEKELFKLPQIVDEDYSLKEYYSGGLYCRQITIPAGALITGRIYKFNHIEMMLSGDIIILSADGGKKNYQGHNVIEAKSGKRQAGLALTDTVWMTINQVPEGIPLHEMLDYTSVLTYEEFDAFYRELNQADYQKFLQDINLTQKEMDEIVTKDDVTEMPSGYEHIYTEASLLNDTGLFTSEPIKKGSIICPARVLDKRTIAGRYANHALHANSLPYTENNIFYFMASADIKKDEEITANYRDVLGFRVLNNDLKIN